MELYLVRHTHTAAPSGICYGRADVSVAETFQEEAAGVVATLEGTGYGRVYSSPLRRCRLLAKELADTITIDARLTELAFGKWELVPWQSVYDRKESEAWFADYKHTAPPAGESYPGMTRRVQDFIDYLPDYDRPPVLVTHAGVIRIFLVRLLGYTIDESFARKIAYGEVVHLVRSDDGVWREEPTGRR